MIKAKLVAAALSAAALTLGVAGLAQGAPHRLAAADVTLEVPDDWEVRPAGRRLTLVSPDGKVTLLAFSLPRDKIEPAIPAIIRATQGVLGPVDFTASRRIGINGMEVIERDGQAPERGGLAVRTFSFATGAEPMVIIAFSQSAASKTARQATEAIVFSARPGAKADLSGRPDAVDLKGLAVKAPLSPDP